MRFAIYGVRLSADATAPTPVVGRFPWGQVQVADSFGEFLVRYAIGDYSVIFPECALMVDAVGIGTEVEGAVTHAVRWVDVRRIEVDVNERDGEAEAFWRIEHSPLAPPFLAPVDLIAGGHVLRARVRALDGFDDDAFQAARTSEQQGKAGSFVVWCAPEMADGGTPTPDGEPCAADLNEFSRRLREADAWCGRRASSGRLRGEIAASVPECPTFEDLHAAVGAVATERRQEEESVRDRHPLGRVLVCAVNESVSSGVSEAASAGFFDAADRPPPGTWVWAVDLPASGPVLLAWVPESLVAQVDAGVAVNPYGRIDWLDKAVCKAPQLRELWRQVERQTRIRRAWKDTAVSQTRAVRRRRLAGG
jgi:hypothetical protein